MYKTEMHCHSKQVSICAQADADLIVEKYLEAGYTTIVSTEHINGGTFSAMKDLSWQDKVTHYMTGYNKLVEAAKGRIHILFGAEIALSKTAPNDFLVYGISEEFLRSIDDPRKLANIQELSPLIRDNNMMIFQAHPFRVGMTISAPSLLDGIEIANFSLWHESYNDVAQIWAKRNNLIGITGTDFHNPDHTPLGGIMTEYPITDNETLLKTLREGTFTPIFGA